MTALEKGNYKIEVTNAIGQLQFSKKVNVSQYNQKETIPCTTSMNPGVYYLSIYDENNKRVKSIGFFINNN